MDTDEKRHERVAKVLTDALIEPHVSELDHLGIEMRQQVLNWATEPDEMQEDVLNTLSEVFVIEADGFCCARVWRLLGCSRIL